MQCQSIVDANDRILVTGAAGFIGSIVVKTLLARGFRNVRCLVRSGSDRSRLEAATRDHRAAIELVRGNLLSRHDCETAASNAAIVFHLAASRGETPIADAFMNSVVTTRNLLDAARRQSTLRRFVNVSSLAVYSNRDKPRRRLLDESCPVDTRPELRGDAYSFCKVMQDEIVGEYGTRFGIPVVTVRPGFVYGPGQRTISARIGVDTFGIFLHLGGGNTMPFTFVDNCADAIVRAGTTPGVDGRVFNVVDDDLPSSRQFLRLYKRHVRSFRSIYIPHAVSYAACWLWEGYSRWSEGQLPPAFNRRGWHATWKRTRYSNSRVKTELSWTPRVSTAEAFERYFQRPVDTKAEHLSAVALAEAEAPPLRTVLEQGPHA